MEGGEVCAPTAVQNSSSPQHQSVCAKPERETRNEAACEDRDMRAADTGEVSIVVRACNAGQALA
ncbi:hypothetical protein C7T86_13290 [Xanthomonas citri pv. malvacearum]|uniref:Uncharacterized protein n=1 Tax=Xanthomonas campestris pv. malvacearum TaxID=86040 RepID=A0AA44Z182_XANCM|nr:hypothetical protein CIW71_15335 [Xanthomonas citri pv. malvacearum]ASY90965.1 hypothetical protein CIW72_14305 [Xanthomonas citri pv. malvacearum]NMI15835.1 hypothetical protein [Xanthomonas citri]PUE92805.1 hypothetical protein C7T86_13290 [Xanthomonas citri pv. malvacearum]